MVRDTYAWKRARKLALHGATICAICQRELDFDAAPRSRWAPSVDHIVPLARGGDPYSQSNLRVAHVGCNSRRGTGRRRRMTSQRAGWW